MSLLVYVINNYNYLSRYFSLSEYYLLEKDRETSDKLLTE